MTEAIKTLNINGKEVEARGSFAFDIEAKKFATKNEKGDVSPGTTNIYQKLVMQDTEGIIEFWQCATAHLSEKPTVEQITNAIEQVIVEKEDTIELLAGALEVMDNSGFFKRQTKTFWSNMNKAISMVSKEEKEQTKIGIQMMKDSYEEITGSQPY